MKMSFQSNATKSHVPVNRFCTRLEFTYHIVCNKEQTVSESLLHNIFVHHTTNIKSNLSETRKYEDI